MRVCLVIIFVLTSISGILSQNLSKVTNYTIKNITIAGNNKTKEKVIHRELLFSIGDIVPQNELDSLLKKSEESLLNTSLFNFVTIKSLSDTNNFLNIYVILEERWYIWPIPILEHADRNLSSFLNEQDWNRINYGLLLEIHNLRGMNEFLKLKFRGGYKEQLQIAYEIPYISKNKKHGLETEFSYFKKKETEYNILDDKPIYYKNDNSFALKYFRGSISYKYRYKHYTHHKFTLGYYNGIIHDSVAILNPEYYPDSESKLEYFNLDYSIDLNKTDIHYYPLKGHKLYFQISQTGLGILNQNFSGITSVTGSAYKYIKLGHKWYTGFGAKGKLSNDYKQPFFIEEGLGYSTYLRSYEYNVISGQRYITTRSFLKYALIPEHIIHLSQVKLRRFNKIHFALYSNIFFETGYVYDKQIQTSNKLPNSFLASTGLGLDFVTYYDIVFRAEYSMNISNESGFFIHVKKAF